MKKWILNMNLHKKFYTLICLLILIPVLVSGIATDAVFLTRFQQQERDVMLNILLQTHNNIRYILDEIDNISLAMLYDESIQSLYRALVLQKGTGSVEVLRRNVLKSLSPMVFNQSYIDAVLVTSGNNKLFEFGETVTREDEELYRQAEAALGRPIWTQARRLNDTVRVNKQYYVSMLRAISDLNQYGQVIGVCRISMEERVLKDLLLEINDEKDTVTAIFDLEGRVISSTDDTLYGQNVLQMQKFRRILEADERSGYVTTYEHGRHFTHLFYRLRDPDWIVVQTIDDQHFRAQFLPLLCLMIGTMSFCLLFASVYSLVIKKTVIRPIQQMYNEMDRVRKGDMSIALPYASDDEIGQLSRQFERMVQELKNLIATRYEQQILLKEAELKNLESQINPHFLYNTLDTIRWIALKNKDVEVCGQIEALSDLFRHVLNKGEEMTTLGEELQYLDDYLLLQKARYGEKIDIRLDVDPTLLNARMPKLLIQPLVENAIYHGIEHKVGNGLIELKACREGDSLLIIVQDNGMGTQEEEVIQQIRGKRSSKMFALHNIDERIKLRYGEAFGERFYSQPGKGTRVELRIPVEM